ncbi:hypothetical protein ABW21_db0207828 [Orbilia brochopaga]|nr:hypothetical protein ABW21_db0207828 [Drechslerella brochopaga]
MVQAHNHIHQRAYEDARSVIVAAWMYDETYPKNPNSLFADVYDPPGSKMRTNELVRWLSSELTKVISEQPHTVIVTAAGSEKITQNEFLAPARDQLAFPDTVVTVGDVDLKYQKKIDDDKRGMEIKAWAIGEGLFAASYNALDKETFAPVQGSSYGMKSCPHQLPATLNNLSRPYSFPNFQIARFCRFDPLSINFSDI